MTTTDEANQLALHRRVQALATDEEILVLRKDEECVCGHGRRQHYNGRGVCLGLDGAGHVCANCSRFRHKDIKFNKALREQQAAILRKYA